MQDRRLYWVWGLFLLQAGCAAFFLGDAILDALGIEHVWGVRESDLVEYLIAVALVLGVVFTGLELRRMTSRHRAMAAQLQVASGAFAELLDQHFEDWGLTAAEREIALMAIKGYSLAEMATLRDTREGTIKAQCSAVYKKAGVTGRLQLLSLFIEELIAEDLVAGAGASRAGTPGA